MIAALYVRADGHYPRMTGVDAWTEERDARGYSGPYPVVGHPPCGPWGRWAWKSIQDATLGPKGVEQVRRWGGVLEHPAKSRLWDACGLPRPGAAPDCWGGWSLEVEQGWWGHRAPKRTWLYVVGLGRDEVPSMPPVTPDPGGRVEFMCEKERESTPPAFAEWLVELARRSHHVAADVARCMEASA